MMNLIQYDPDEYMDSAVSDVTLQFIADMYGPEVRDRLLYKVGDYVECNRDAV